VVAIIGVLVAISIPIFHAQLRKARLATNKANARAAFSAAEAAYLDYVAAWKR
jgi:type II secretory pathway pseudopilin PulG